MNNLRPRIKQIEKFLDAEKQKDFFSEFQFRWEGGEIWSTSDVGPIGSYEADLFSDDRIPQDPPKTSQEVLDREIKQTIEDSKKDGSSMREIERMMIEDKGGLSITPMSSDDLIALMGGKKGRRFRIGEG